MHYILNAAHSMLKYFPIRRSRDLGIYLCVLVCRHMGITVFQQYMQMITWFI